MGDRSADRINIVNSLGDASVRRDDRKEVRRFEPLESTCRVDPLLGLSRTS